MFEHKCSTNVDYDERNLLEIKIKCQNRAIEQQLKKHGIADVLLPAVFAPPLI